MKKLLFIFAFLVLPLSVFAADDKDAADVQRAELYLNSIQSAKARFVQTTHDGTQLVGSFYLKRPGKLKFVYDDPIKDFVVADGVFIYFYDAELKEQTNAPIGQTLADFILREDLSLTSKDVKVSTVRHSGDYLQIELAQQDDQAGGSLILGFDEDPMTLKKWRVIDPQGLITEIELFYLETGIDHPKGFFAYHPPEDTDPAFNE